MGKASDIARQITKRRIYGKLNEYVDLSLYVLEMTDGDLRQAAATDLGFLVGALYTHIHGIPEGLIQAWEAHDVDEAAL